MIQMAQQLVIGGANFSIYVCTAEVCILSLILLQCATRALTVLRTGLSTTRSRYAEWGHTSRQVVPAFCLPDEKVIVQNKLPFWTLVNTYVISHGPMRPVLVLRNALQAFFSRTKGGVYTAHEIPLSNELPWTQGCMGTEAVLVLFKDAGCKRVRLLSSESMRPFQPNRRRFQQS